MGWNLPFGTGLELERGWLWRVAGPLGGDLVEAVEAQLRLLDKGGDDAELNPRPRRRRRRPPSSVLSMPS
jgi:hypothetical protein